MNQIGKFQGRQWLPRPRRGSSRSWCSAAAPPHSASSRAQTCNGANEDAETPSDRGFAGMATTLRGNGRKVGDYTQGWIRRLPAGVGLQTAQKLAGRPAVML